MKMLAIKMYRDIFVIVEYFVNKVSPCLCGRSIFCFSEELRYYRDFLSLPSQKKRVLRTHRWKWKSRYSPFHAISIQVVRIVTWVMNKWISHLSFCTERNLIIKSRFSENHASNCVMRGSFQCLHA